MRNNGENKPTSTYHIHSLGFLDVCLNLTVIPLSVASIWVIVTNKQDSVYGSLQFSNLTGLKYLVSINAICAAYALIVIVFSWLRGSINSWILFVTDQVLAYLMVTSGCAVAELLYSSYKGDREVSWSEACTSYGKFCSKMKVSLALHVVVLVCFLVLSLISAYRVLSRYEAPCVSSKEEEEQGS
ncbi:CASP-like protein 2D1 [Tasmannia lanceolata]|uniref:CASP-like protein 2D1 n=1 Tax=Tasmannia lanceolata TaxID=3420 RepID=UPI004064A29C